jgi:hypothetical protein
VMRHPAPFRAVPPDLGIANVSDNREPILNLGGFRSARSRAGLPTQTNAGERRTPLPSVFPHASRIGGRLVNSIESAALFRLPSANESALFEACNRRQQQSLSITEIWKTTLPGTESAWGREGPFANIGPGNVSTRDRFTRICQGRFVPLVTATENRPVPKPGRTQSRGLRKAA